MNVGLIYGSTREGRLCDRITNWVAAEINKSSRFSLDLIDPNAFDLSFRHERQERAGLKALRSRLHQADAFIIATPEYNHGYPAPLKFIIDSAKGEWRAKPIAFVSYGGISGGLRAVEQLRLVFAELHSVTIRDTVSFANAWSRFDEAGRLMEPQNAPEAMNTLLTNLGWWAGVLKSARSETIYGELIA
ncbi:MAG: NADPH-dependent FMN reductase [Phyllobacterium sp.]